ncbi:glutamate--cysteine ligase [Thalassotalea sp. ND16A]|uniref:glutamate--cysteine ligase n=1 Tax=Thalassotalea sp. ND16A TaxID=1535422 RepID=UPI00051D13FF|nr:glutamate--cysteine ligase [Thalassotalea sp. ND16A]KGJ90293.1 hypothetical protein ND16A_2023 [Thalassotalea sp. ND16A]
MTFSILDLTQAFEQHHLSAISGAQRGIERETLRIKPDGNLSTQGHNSALGSALTHQYITTDYSESLLEFITPVSTSIDESLNQLKDIQKFTLNNIDGDYFWPMSMPCMVDNEEQVQLAQYGSSNIGTMKTVYRQGLKNRYGSMMQVIAGIHFNFSFSKEFFNSLQEITDDSSPLQDFISDRYFALIRNYKRHGWLIPYLFGSSPALCPSFLQGKPHQLPFKKAPAGCLYLEHATSLRMSDLGYTSSEQANLKICNNNIDTYVSGVQQAINLPSEQFAHIGVKLNGEYKQLNSNILQIENELYAPIRPKRVAKSGQKPSDALKEGGVEYIEVRAMDVNPFVSTGISKEQMHFLDVFITYCMLKDSPQMSIDKKRVFNSNTDKVVLEGRKPGLTLNDNGIEKTIPEWGAEIFAEMQLIAGLYDKAYATTAYSDVIKDELAKIHDPQLTPSARILDELFTTGKGIVTWSMEYVEQFSKELTEHSYQVFDEKLLQQLAETSLQKQAEIENSDTLSFDDFLEEYFSK